MSNQITAQPIQSTTMDHQNHEATVAGRAVPDRQMELAQAAVANTTPTAQAVVMAEPSNSVMEIAPGADNTVMLPAGTNLDDAVFRVEGADLIVVLGEGSELVVTGGAINIPTFLIGDVELPQEALFAALDASDINIAARPDGYSASTRAPNSNADFDDSAIISDFQNFAMASLLEVNRTAAHVSGPMHRNTLTRDLVMQRSPTGQRTRISSVASFAHCRSDGKPRVTAVQ